VPKENDRNLAYTIHPLAKGRFRNAHSSSSSMGPHLPLARSRCSPQRTTPSPWAAPPPPPAPKPAAPAGIPPPRHQLGASLTEGWWHPLGEAPWRNARELLRRTEFHLDIPCSEDPGGLVHVRTAVCLVESLLGSKKSCFRGCSLNESPDLKAAPSLAQRPAYPTPHPG
jgi:hypothetical protein